MSLVNQTLESICDALLYYYMAFDEVEETFVEARLVGSVGSMTPGYGYFHGLDHEEFYIPYGSEIEIWELVIQVNHRWNDYPDSDFERMLIYREPLTDSVVAARHFVCDAQVLFPPKGW